MGAGESKPSQKENTELTTDELIKRWKGKPEIKKLENYLNFNLYFRKKYKKKIQKQKKRF